MAVSQWRSISCAANELNLAVLGLGQSFRWKRVLDNDKEISWRGVMANRIWQLKHENDRLYYKVLGKCFQLIIVIRVIRVD